MVTVFEESAMVPKAICFGHEFLPAYIISFTCLEDVFLYEMKKFMFFISAGENQSGVKDFNTYSLYLGR